MPPPWLWADWDPAGPRKGQHCTAASIACPGLSLLRARDRGGSRLWQAGASLGQCWCEAGLCPDMWPGAGGLPLGQRTFLSNGAVPWGAVLVPCLGTGVCLCPDGVLGLWCSAQLPCWSVPTTPQRDLGGHVPPRQGLSALSPEISAGTSPALPKELLQGWKGSLGGSLAFKSATELGQELGKPRSVLGLGQASPRGAMSPGTKPASRLPL